MSHRPSLQTNSPFAAYSVGPTLLFVPGANAPSGTPPPSPVLVVVPDPIQAAQLAKRVFKRGLPVAIACDTTEAIASMKTARFELILADPVMPGREGLRWIKQVVSEPDAPKVAIVASQPSLDAVTDAASLPLAGFFVEPISDEDLDSLLRRALPAEALS